MTVKKISPIAALLLTTAPAFAEITAQDAWELMQKYGENGGLEMSGGTVQETSDGLTVTNLRYTMNVPDVSMVMQVDRMVFKELGNGTVQATASDIPFAMTMQAEGETVEMAGHMSLPGGHSIMSGDPENYTATMAYPTMVFTLDSVVVDGEAIPIEAEMRGENVDGFVTIVDSGEFGVPPQQTNEYSLSKATLGVDVQVPEDEGGGQVMISAQFNDIDVSGTGTIVPFDGSGFPVGAQSQTTLKRGGSAVSFNLDGPDGELNVEATDENGVLVASLESGSVTYENKVNGTRISVSGSVLPLPPIEIGMKSSSFGLTAPVQPSPDERDFALSMAIEGLEVSDFLWSMLDPFNNLPHDPADIALAISGTGELSVDVFDPDFNPEAMTAAPGSVSTIAIDNFLLSAVGAEITATGSATNMEDNPLAMPRMAGALDVSAKGIQGLMENLGKMGILPVQQASMANMMLGMFAVPGDQPDSFTSHIEMNQDGGILVNGQPVR